MNVNVTATDDPTTFDWLNFIASAVGAVGTLIALAVALAFGIYEVRKLRQERTEREVERADRQKKEERAQAEQVTGWIEYRRADNVQPDLSYGQVNVYNASRQPIYDACVLVFHDDDHYRVWEIGYVPPGDTGHQHLPPSKRRPLHRTPAHIAFRDAAERWWERPHDGRLVPLDKHPWPRDGGDPPHHEHEHR